MRIDVNKDGSHRWKILVDGGKDGEVKYSE
jgi:hypothetical protein